jgi:TonB family protein
VSYVINKEGNLIAPVVTDSSGIVNFESEALKAMKKWKFKPAKQNGEAIQQCDLEVQLDFKLNGKGLKLIRQIFR